MERWRVVLYKTETAQAPVERFVRDEITTKSGLARFSEVVKVLEEYGSVAKQQFPKLILQFHGKKRWKELRYFKVKGQSESRVIFFFDVPRCEAVLLSAYKRSAPRREQDQVRDAAVDSMVDWQHRRENGV